VARSRSARAHLVTNHIIGWQSEPSMQGIGAA
jgi:hypothetical protein